MGAELLRTIQLEDWEKKAIFKVLDELDPFSNPAALTFDEAQSFREFVKWKEEIVWCPQLRIIVDEGDFDMYDEFDGDDRLYELAYIFNLARREWALQKLEDATTTEETKVAQKYLKYVTDANNSNKLTGFAKYFCKLKSVSADVLNKDPESLGTRKGVLDLSYGCLVVDKDMEMSRYGEPVYCDDAKKQNVTKRCRGSLESYMYGDFDYDERWEEFISEIMCGDEERIDYLQRALGYSLLGTNPEEVMFIAYGATTRNGKGTLLNTIAYVLGDYAANMPADFLTRRKSGNASNHDDALGALEGKRFVTMSEPTAGLMLDEAKIKALTGNDPITVARKYCPTRTFIPEFTMWLSCNQLPNVDDRTIFTSERIRVIPFERHFTKEEQDPSLKTRFLKENGLDTILTWLLRGYEKWKEKGLTPPQSIIEQTQQWAETGGSDLQRFIDECCVRSVDSKIKRSELHDAYKLYCEGLSTEPIKKSEIIDYLKKLSIPTSTVKGIDYYRGIDLKK